MTVFLDVAVQTETLPEGIAEKSGTIADTTDTVANFAKFIF